MAPIKTGLNPWYRCYPWFNAHTEPFRRNRDSEFPRLNGRGYDSSVPLAHARSYERERVDSIWILSVAAPIKTRK